MRIPFFISPKRAKNKAGLSLCRNIFPAFVFLLFLPPLSSQRELVFDQLDVDGNISQSIVYCIEQDSFGNLWAGTEEGVIRYNSIDLFLYDKYNGLPENLANRIMSMYLDQTHTLWIGTEEGISCFLPKSNRFEFFKPNNDQVMTLVECISENDKGQLLVGAFNGLWLVDTDSTQVLPLVTGKQVYSVLPLSVDILFGTGNGLFRYIPEQGNSQELFQDYLGNGQMITALQKIGNRIYIGTESAGLFVTDPAFLSIEPVRIKGIDRAVPRINEILALNNGEILLATDGIGLVIMDEDGNLIRWARDDVDDESSISSNGIYDLLLGKENLLWIATYGGGINKLSLRQSDFRSITHITNDNNSIAHNLTRVIREDREGNIWFGTKNGLSIYNPANGSWKNIPSLDQKAVNPDIILDIAEDGPFMWLATYGNGLFRLNKNDFSSEHYYPGAPGRYRIGLNSIYTLLKDSWGNLWAGGIGNNMFRLDPAGTVQTYPVIPVKDIIELRDNRILIAGRNGVQLIDESGLSDIDVIKAGRNGLNYTNINCVVEKGSGELLIGTNGNGLVFYTPGETKFRVRDRLSGLPSDIVQSIILEGDSSIWLGTTRGLVHLNIYENDTLITVYEKEDGLVSNEFNYGSAARLLSGEMLFGGVEGVVVFDPRKMSVQENTPRIVLEDFRLLNQKRRSQFELEHHINFQDRLTLEYSQNSFNIRFAGIMNANSSKVLYSWKMDGLKDEWANPGQERQINFVNLSPGEYLLRIRASNRDGMWSQERILPIEVMDPWWQTSFAYFLYVIFGMIAFSGLIYTISLFINKRNAEEQVNFFNSITHELKTPLTILLTTLEGLPRKDAEPNLKKIKTTSRQLINLFEQLLNFHLSNASRSDFNNIEPILIRNHVEKTIQSFRPLLEEKEIDVELIDNLSSSQFYYERYSLDKILYNLISNAVKYSRQKGQIKLSMADQKGDLILTVADNGIGIPRDQQKNILRKYYRGRNAINSQLPGSGLGLMIVKNMIEKEKGSINFKSIENEGSTFVVRLKDKKRFYQQKEVNEDKELKLVLEENEEIAEFSDAKILVVEDNDELRSFLVEKLGTYFQVYEASDGASGLEMAEKVFPDLIITDLIMPEMDGMAMCKSLQENINLNHIPIFMMTVLNSQKQKLESVEMGVTSYIEKPIDLSYLLAKIVNTLSWSKKMRERYLHQVDVENAEKFRNRKDATFIDNLEHFILQEIRQESLSVHDLCKYVGMSRTALYMKLKSMVDLSPQNFIIHTRLKFARKKLLEGEVNVKEVAYMCGFSSPKYFSTSFKKLFGDTPSGFMKKLQDTPQ
jgi:signal transduction histidine kinase/ligand-binding sensor domain-containing protein/DNA-binding response OmpR family regulator